LKKERLRDGAQGLLKRATVAEKDYKITDGLLHSLDSPILKIHYWTDDQDSIAMPDNVFGIAEAECIIWYDTSRFF